MLSVWSMVSEMLISLKSWGLVITGVYAPSDEKNPRKAKFVEKLKNLVEAISKPK